VVFYLLEDAASLHLKAFGVCQVLAQPEVLPEFLRGPTNITFRYVGSYQHGDRSLTTEALYRVLESWMKRTLSYVVGPTAENLGSGLFVRHRP
jgi:hypothetical protein